MKILLAAGVYPPQVGGPSYYAFFLNQEFKKRGIITVVVAYGPLLKFPSIVRHFLYFIKLFIEGFKSDAILSFDSLSVGFPAVIVGKILRKKVVLRLGGDFLWEQYVERSKEKITLSEFYTEYRNYSLKEKVILKLTKFVLRNSTSVVFNTTWLRDIFIQAYELEKDKTFIIENAFEVKHNNQKYTKKNYLWAGRSIFLKNTDMLKRAFQNAQKVDKYISLEIYENLPHAELMEKIMNCYAVIYPSLSEVSPNLVLEALSFGKPSLVTKETGYKDFLEKYVLFVNPLSEVDISKKIILLSKDEVYTKLVSNITTLNICHTYGDIAKEYEDLFRKTL